MNGRAAPETLAAALRPAGAPANDLPGRAPGAASPRAGTRGTTARVSYLLCLAWAFTIFNAVRLLTYLPTIWAVHQSAASDQHSLLTWFAWFGANLTMGLWLYEQADQRLERAALVNLGNAAMCFITGIVIVLYR